VLAISSKTATEALAVASIDRIWGSLRRHASCAAAAPGQLGGRKGLLAPQSDRSPPLATPPSILFIGDRTAEQTVLALRSALALSRRLIDLACPSDARELALLLAQRGHGLAVIDVDWLRSRCAKDSQDLQSIPSETACILGGRTMPEDWFEWAMASRARGLVTWDQPADLLAKALQSVEEGDVWLPRAMTRRLYEALLARPLGELLRDEKERSARAGSTASAAQARALSAREQEVLLSVRQGLTNKEIALRLGISSSTVKKHLSMALHKLGMRSRRQVSC
jgi:DNA-binding NarL/FixJ family response regulator